MIQRTYITDAKPLDVLRAEVRVRITTPAYRADAGMTTTACARVGILPPGVVHANYRVVLDGKTYEFKDANDCAWWAKNHAPAAFYKNFRCDDHLVYSACEDARAKMIAREQNLWRDPEPATKIDVRNDQREGEDAQQRFLRHRKAGLR